MSYTYDPLNERLIDDDPGMNDLGKRILRLKDTYDSSMLQEPKTVDQGAIKKNKLNPRQYKQMMDYLTKPKEKSNTDERREQEKKKPIPKGPTKLAKSKEDVKEEFEVIEIPIIMKEFEQFLLDNPSKTFQDFLKEQSKVNEKQKKQLDDMILAGALGKINDRMSGIMQNFARGGIIRDPSFTYYNSGGKVKKPKPIKQIDLMNYHKLGMTMTDLSDYEKQLVSDLLRKTLPTSFKKD
jgi:hypothetical protein